MPIFCQKNVHSLKNIVLSCHFFKSSLKTHFRHFHIWSKKRRFYWNYAVVWTNPYLVKATSILLELSYSMDQKTWYNPLFPDLWRKTHSSHAYFLSKKCPFSKIHNAFMPIFCEQNIHSLKKSLSCNFVKFFMKSPHCLAIFGPKKVNSVKLHYIFEQKSQKNALFFLPIFTKQNPLSRASFLWINVNSRKKCSHAYNLSIKRPFS